MIIPTLSDGSALYTQRVNLDGQDYQLDFRWNTRLARWYLNLRDSDGALLAASLKVLTNWPLLAYYHGREGMPPGELWCVSLGVSSDPPGLDEMGEGRRCTMVYYPAGT
jgi:hypothetical protein